MSEANQYQHKELKTLGFDQWFQERLEELYVADCSPARVTEVHRDSFTVRNENNEIPAELTGNLLFSANSVSELPCVGDWVMVRYYNNDTLAIIHGLLPRKSFLRRKTPGKKIEYQMIAANIDTGFIVQASDFDFNIRRLERYLVMVREGGIKPVIILTKSDLIDPAEMQEKAAKIQESGIECETIILSNKTGEGRTQVQQILEEGKTCCLIGSSGVGKTTLLNSLIGREVFSTKSVRHGDGKGRHSTTRRQLILLANGAMVIDTPGMRELGNIEVSDGIAESFSDIEDLAGNCRFSNCGHTSEIGCAVIEALRNGELDEHRFQSYLKLMNESRFHEMSFMEKRKREKDFGKMIKSVLRHNQKNKQ